jgi:Clostridium epsilon toxin ETX/Bacillus mosquitocidal toxin MTX2
MGLKPGSLIKANGEWLRENDYIQSASRLFFAVQQNNGEFCVYRGSGPEDRHGKLWGTGATSSGGEFFAAQQGDGNFCVYKGTGPAVNRGFVWGSMKTGPAGDYFAILQDDGNFCVYKGTGPSDNRGFVWASMKTDLLSDFQIDRIDYHVARAQVLKSGSVGLYRQTVTNHTTSPQTSTIAGSETVTETSGWSDSLAISVGVKTSFKCGIPFFAEGKVEISAQATNTYTWNGSESKAKAWSWSTPVTVPPGGVSSVIVTATMSTIAVPYTATGTAVFKSGEKVAGQITGLYTGDNSHDLTVTFAHLDPVSGHVHVDNADQ